jgi:L-ascorbate metabolism protein UlaG (beta-lactamase superfamily)
MLRSLLTLTLAVVLTGSASAKNVTIKYHGQSFFVIKSSSGTVIAIDPHNIEAYGRLEIKADAVLISHFHIDHCSPEPIVDFEKTKVLYGLKNEKGFTGLRKNDEFNEFDVKVKDVQIKSIGCYHDKVQGMQRGKNSIFILEVDGLRIVHLGDLGHSLSPGQLKAIGKVDVLMVPVGGVYALNGKDAKQVVAQLSPSRYILPMHYGTKVYSYLLTEDEFLDEQDEKIIKRLKDNEMVIDADAVPRKDQPYITFLSYEEKEKEKDK